MSNALTQLIRAYPVTTWALVGVSAYTWKIIAIRSYHDVHYVDHIIGRMKEIEAVKRS